MDAIKKKMQSLKTETDNALQRAEELDKEAKEATQRAEKYEESVSFVLEVADALSFYVTKMVLVRPN